MASYYIRVNGRSKSFDSLQQMLQNQRYPFLIEITGIVNDENPQSSALIFKRNLAQPGYRFNRKILQHGQAPQVVEQELVQANEILNMILQKKENYFAGAQVIQAPAMMAAEHELIEDALDLGLLEIGPQGLEQQNDHNGALVLPNQPMMIDGPLAQQDQLGQLGGRRRRRKATNRRRHTSKRRASYRRRH